VYIWCYRNNKYIIYIIHLALASGLEECKFDYQTNKHIHIIIYLLCRLLKMSYQVIQRNTEYNGECADYWKDAPFPLSDFQKWAIDAYHTDKHVLVTAHTGSGKTYPAEHAIRDCIRNGRKLIYTSPIKSLSNQKFYDFQRKFPEASVGILTGDIKYNPEGNVLIMTTEILRNLVFYQHITDPVSKLTIELNIARDFHCVVFDEVHYINDVDRGRVWEETLVLLPQHIRLILLSATIDNPVEFCQWIADIKQRDVVLTSTYHRVVPLRHCLFTSMLPSYYHGRRSTDQQKTLATEIDKKLVVFDSNTTNGFHDPAFDKWYKSLSIVAEGVSRNTMIHDCVNYLYEEDLCPAIFFTFSKVRCEALAKQTATQLLQSNEIAEVIRIIDYYIGNSPNRESYKVLPQWIDLRRCLEKGVGFHHSGLVPLFKEIVEMLYEKNLVKVLFATETFAVGVNMPTRTVVFTALEKFVSGGQSRHLYAFEYLQMAGRAGRRGIDTLGTAIILPYAHGNSSIDLPDKSTIRGMIHGRSQFIQSKFTLDYTFVLKMILNDVPLLKWVEKSLYSREIQHEIEGLCSQHKKLLEEAEQIKIQQQVSETDEVLCHEYKTIMNRTANQRSATQRKRIDELQRTKGFMVAWRNYSYQAQHDAKIVQTERELHAATESISATLSKVLRVLKKNGYLMSDELSVQSKDVSLKGRIASELMECHPILITELLMSKSVDSMSFDDWAGVLGLFCDSRPIDRNLEHMEDEYVPEHVYHTLRRIEEVAEDWKAEEATQQLCLGTNWELNRYMVGAMIRWCDSTTSLREIIDYYNIFEGNFIKDVLKYFNMCAELERVATIAEKPELLMIVSQMREVLMREIVGVESIYVKT
jgi:superfamily II RNA helicase